MQKYIDALTPKERENYDRWLAAHNYVCDCASVTLLITNTPIGPAVRINCRLLKEHDLTDYDSW